MEIHTMKYYGSIAGILAPIIYGIIVFGLGIFEPGFNHLTDMMSLLGGVEGIRGFLFNVGVIVTGLMVMIFAVGINSSLNDGQGSRVGSGMLFIGGIGLASGGIFHCDEGCANFLAMTPIGVMHLVSAAIGGMFTALSLFALYFRMKHDVYWKAYGWFTLAMALLGNGAGILLWISYPTDSLIEFQGLIQRLGIIFPLIWIGTIAGLMLKSVREESSASHTS
ncbi:MAG: DUF998 domain-containing protein [Promethearchaeota archaeon]